VATEESIIHIQPYHYIHDVLDQNSNVSCVEIGPKTYIWQENERFLSLHWGGTWLGPAFPHPPALLGGSLMSTR
uniref:Uncharacterized protein n=1 Tax=Monodon monoceros TaxID=40151 RepID=A0A8C6F6P5_MONMO